MLARLISVVVLLGIFIFSAKAQVERPVRAPGGLPIKGDTLKPFSPDSASIKNDTLKSKQDSVKQAKKGDIETTILYSARDSINSNLEKKIVKLYGNAKIKYGEIELEAEEIVIDYELSTITANGKLDSAGRRVGFPVFKDGPAVYETRDMVYNFKTKKAKISEVVTQQGDGFLHGETVFKNDQNELFSIGNAYTTCNLAHPHFRIISSKTKAIPGDKIVSGPFYMEFNDVPTPLGFAFGIFPSQRKSASGIIFPVYGEERQRGFFLRGGGYFFDISDFVKLGITADLYSKGSTALQVMAPYSKRYAYTGNFNFNFTSNRLTQNIEDNSKSRDFRITWSHSPQTRGTGRFSASVNAATASFTQNNYLGVNASALNTRLDNTTRKMSSNISYSKTFAGTPFAAGINLRHNQDLSTRQVDLPMPDVSFNMNNLYPFKKSTSEFLENISIRLTSSGTNSITNNLGRLTPEAKKDSIAPFNLDNLPQFFKNSKKGVRHNIPLGTSVKVLKFLTLSPSLGYDELWYFEKLNWRNKNEFLTNPLKPFDDQWAFNKSNLADTLVADTIKGFNRVSTYSGSVGVNTRIYGMWVSKNKNSRVRAIRHILNPSVSYSFQPDFADSKFDYYQTFKTKNNQVLLKSRHEGFVYGTARQGKSSALGFNLGNNLEMKVRGEKDTVDRKVSLLNSLSIGSSYNLAADSFKLSSFSFSANTNVLNDKINLNVSAAIDPYQYKLLSIADDGAILQRKVDRYVWKDRRSLGQISSANFAFSTNLSPKGRDKDQNTREKITKADNLTESDKQYLLQNPDAYVDFSIPWNLRINYSLDYTKRGYEKPTITQAIRFSGDLSLTEKWKVDFNSGFDFQSKEFTQSNIGVRRDLHCWQVSLNWVPFGRFQSYNFSIGIKSGMLRDLKLDRTRAFQDLL
jgi:lipopolysaccharide export system protein LptA